jgi:peptidoglycan/xylan/chitin deacetylase (PgdA/CDA1 family)
MIQSHRIFNLTFHGLGVLDRPLEGDEAKYWLNVEAFTEVLDRASHWTNTGITFDDGNLSDLTIGIPLLRNRGLTATFFVVAGRIGKKGYLGRSELREVIAAGMRIGSHGMHHLSWRRLHQPELKQEIFGARAMLEDVLGVPVTQAACPFGEYGTTVLKLLAECGFSRVFTSDRGWARPTAWIQPRNTIARDIGVEKLQNIRDWAWPTRVIHQCKLAVKRHC